MLSHVSNKEPRFILAFDSNISNMQKEFRDSPLCRKFLVILEIAAIAVSSRAALLSRHVEIWLNLIAVSSAILLFVNLLSLCIRAPKPVLYFEMFCSVAVLVGCGFEIGGSSPNRDAYIFVSGVAVAVGTFLYIIRVILLIFARNHGSFCSYCIGHSLSRESVSF